MINKFMAGRNAQLNAKFFNNVYESIKKHAFPTVFDTIKNHTNL